MTAPAAKERISPRERARTACGLMCGGRVNLKTGVRIGIYNLCASCRIRLDAIAADAGVEVEYGDAVQQDKRAVRKKVASKKTKRRSKAA